MQIAADAFYGICISPWVVHIAMQIFLLICTRFAPHLFRMEPTLNENDYILLVDKIVP